MTVPAPTDAKPADTSAPAPTSTPAKTATQGSIPTSNSTPNPDVVTLTRDQDGMVMVYVPEGDFVMGTPAGAGGDDEGPEHNVTLDAFWIDRTEVTNAQYRVFVDATGHREPTTCQSGEPTYDDGTKANHPVACVSWDDAQAYCAWAGGRLPTEAEWEKAARGTDGRIYPWGSAFDGSRTNYCDVNCAGDHKDTGFDDGYAQTAPVGSYPTGVSPYGALDMGGNVWEWVSDWYDFYYYVTSPQDNPQGPDSPKDNWQAPGACPCRVLRGGSWFGFATNERVAYRAWFAPDKQDLVVGFRCVISAKASP